MAVAKLAGAEIHYAEAGDGPALLLLHDITYDGRLWAAQAAALAKRFRVIVPDLRGHGRSSAPTIGYGPLEYADDMLQLADRLELDAFHVCGLSLGGGVATEMALLAPNRVRSLTLLAPVFSGWNWSPEWRALWRRLLTAKRDLGTHAALHHVWLESDLHRCARGNMLTRSLLEAMMGSFSGAPLEALPTASDIRPTTRKLRELHTPTCIAVGEDDLVDFHAIAAHAVAEMPNATLWGIPGAGHVLPLEAPGPVFDLICEHATSSEARPKAWMD